MDLKLVNVQYHKKELKDSTEEWWIIEFRNGDDRVKIRIENDEYTPEDWAIGAKYTYTAITKDDVITSSIKLSDHKKQKKLV
jgi:hypothetical protein